MYNTSFLSVPIGPYWRETDIEWRRFEKGDAVRTNKDVEFVEWARWVTYQYVESSL